MRYSTPILFLLAVVALAGCDSANDANTIDRSIAQYPTGVVGKDIFYSTTLVPNMFNTDAEGIYSLNYDGSGNAFLYKRANLTSAPRDTQMVFSIDSSVYLANTKGTSLKRLFNAGKPVFLTILSPNGEKILYASSWDEDSLNIYDIQSGVSMPLIAPGFMILTDNLPVFSDDSRKILFSIDESSVGGSVRLYLINVDGTNKQLVADNVDYLPYLHRHNHFNMVFDMSPDGSFVVYRTRQSKLLIKNMASGHLDTLPTANPKWSPSGNYVYCGNAVYNIQTKELRPLTVSGGSYPNGNVYAFDWTTNEQSMIIQFSDPDPFADFKTTLALMNATSGVIEREYNLRNMLTCFRARARGEH